MSGMSVVKGTMTRQSQKTGVEKRNSTIAAMFGASGIPSGHTYEYTIRKRSLKWRESEKGGFRSTHLINHSPPGQFITTGLAIRLRTIFC